MAQPPAAYLAVIRGIDAISRFTGYVFALLVIPLVLANTWEVFSRKVLGNPTTWAMETTIASYGALFMLGAGYALLQGAHVRTDMLWDKFGDRTKGIIDSIAFLGFFLPSMAVLAWISFGEFQYAIEIDERSNLTAWQPPLWPLRAVVPLAAAMLFVQGISELMKSLWAARTGVPLVHHEKIEI